MTEQPDLAIYDLIIANISGGKDSQGILDVLVEQARDRGEAEKIVAVHADLGRVEWAGTSELARYHADSYGVRFMAVSRPQGDLLEHIESRGMFHSAGARYCTSDHTRGQVAKAITALVGEIRDAGDLEDSEDPGGTPRQTRVLSVMGIRAEGSRARSKKQAHTTDMHATGGRRSVEIWFPILDWTAE